MEALISILKSAAPALATAVAGPLGGAAVTMIADKLGLSDKTVEAVTEALTTNPESIQKLKELDLEFAKIDAADRDSARKMQMTNRSIMPAVLSVVTVIGFFSLLIGAATGFLSLTGSDVMMLLLGVLARETASVYNFWLGSSNSSQQKDMMKGIK
jgi:hypothetical protein